MTKTQKQSWEQERSKGEARPVWREGFLRRGFPYGFIMIAVPLILNNFTHHPTDPVSKLCVEFAFYVVAFGGCMGIQLWRDNERDYLKPTEDEDMPSPEAN